jgi:hypothetical protein
MIPARAFLDGDRLVVPTQPETWGSWRWFMHNAVTHPIAGLLWFVGMRWLADKVHPPHAFTLSGVSDQELARSGLRRVLP